MDALIKAEAQRDGVTSRKIGLTSNLIPEAKVSKKGTKAHKQGCQGGMALAKIKKQRQQKEQDNDPHWFVLRATYGREKKAYDFIIASGATAFWPSIEVTKRIDGRIKTFEESRIPNILFVYGTRSDVDKYTNDKKNIPYIRYYCKRNDRDGKQNDPVKVPHSQMESFRKICSAKDQDIIVTTKELPKFEVGKLVRITSGIFVGVVGRVAHYRGQQRVGIIIDDLATVITSYVPSGMMEEI